MQLDPGLKQLLLRRTGSTSTEVSETHANIVVPVVARLVDASRAVDGMDIVARFGSVVTGRVALGAIGRLRADPNIASLKASRVFGASLSRSLADIDGGDVRGGPMGSETMRGRGVIVAVIDWGCDFVHANFRRPDGTTRLVGIWDQRGGEHPLSPPQFRYGRFLDRDTIDQALTSADPYAALDYDPAEIDPTGIGTHGTHVLDIAAGNGAAPGAAPGVAPEADLLFVHLRGDDTMPTDTLGDSVSLLEAVRFVIDCAGDRPVVLNLSMGRHGGPHDGTTPLELAMDEALGERGGRAIVMSTGNYFDSRVHAAGRVEPGGSARLDWSVLPRSEATAALEIWYAGADRFALELVDPIGQKIGPIALGEDLVVRDGDHIVASVFHRAADPNNGDNHIEIFVWPSAQEGRWQVLLGGELAENGTFHAWIERDDPGSQSRFPVDEAIRQATTNTICNGHAPITTGAYAVVGEVHSLLPFSSSGPTRDGRAKPDLVAPGGRIRAARSSRIVDGERTHDELTIKSGTSMASPHVAGTVALMFEAAGARRLCIDEVRAMLCESARPIADLSDEDRQRAGAGRLHTRRAVELAAALHETLVVASDATILPEPPTVCDPLPPRRIPAHEAFTQLARALPSMRSLARFSTKGPA